MNIALQFPLEDMLDLIAKICGIGIFSGMVMFSINHSFRVEDLLA